MAFKAALIVLAPDGDPEKHKASIQTPKLELTIVVTRLMDFERAAKICTDLVQNQGIQSIVLCPGFTHTGVAMIVKAVGEAVPVSVARSDVPGTMATAEVLGQQGWFPGAH
jgi:hypothetical protein